MVREYSNHSVSYCIIFIFECCADPTFRPPLGKGRKLLPLFSRGRIQVGVRRGRHDSN
jgi:hypothetical protein